MSQDYVVLVAGPMGAGKTTAIGALSDIPVVSTDVANTDLSSNAKARTTACMDYGEIDLGSGERIRLYGIPGQERFDFMWKILEERALGLLLLVDNSAADALTELERFMRVFRSFLERGTLVVGLTRNDCVAARPSTEYLEILRKQARVIPVLRVDARERTQVRTMLSVLVAMVEAKTAAAVAMEALA